MSKQFHNPPTLFPSLQYGFSQIAVVQGSHTVYLSGQVAWDAQQQLVGGDDLGLQTRQALQNVALAMQAAGSSLADVVSMRLYIVQSKLDEGQAITEALKAFFPADRAPTTTWIGVPGLAEPDFLVEIEAVGVLE